MITIKDLNFQMLFGQCEMECAAKRIVMVTQYDPETPVKIDDFRTNLEKEGFHELIHNNWLTPALNSPVGYYEVTPEFWKKINSRVKQ